MGQRGVGGEFLPDLSIGGVSRDGGDGLIGKSEVAEDATFKERSSSETPDEP